MAGLLDGVFDSEGGRLGLGLLAAGSARGDGAGFGQRLMEAFGSVDQWKKQQQAALEAKQMQEYRAMQMQEMKAKQEQDVIDRGAVRNAFAPISGGQAMANGQGPTIENALNIGQVPQFDPRQFLSQNPQASVSALKQAMELNSTFNPKKKYGFQTVDGNLVRTDEEGWASPVFTAAPKPTAKPSEIQEYEYAVSQGEKRNFTDWKQSIKRAGASNQTMINAGPKAFETELGKIDAQQLDEWRKGAMNAQNTLGVAKRLEEADAKGAYSGGAANLKMTVGSYINGLTGATPKGQIGSELYNAEAKKLVLESIKGLGANPSNADREFIEQTIPQLTSNPDARRALTKFIRDKATQSISLYDRANSHARKNSGLNGFNIVEPTNEWSITPVGQ